MSDTCWYDMLKAAMTANGDEFDTCECTLDAVDLNEKFDSGYGVENGKPFTAWGEKYVYFPVCYDGSEWVGSAPRNPCDIATGHQGG